MYSKNLQVKGVIFDSAPGERRLTALFKAISAIDHRRTSAYEYTDVLLHYDLPFCTLVFRGMNLYFIAYILALTFNVSI